MSLRMRSLGLAIASVLLVPGALHAQDVSGAGFYPFRGSARTIGLAGAYTAIADDTAGMMWNPAGIAQVTNRQAAGDLKVNTGGEDYWRLAYIEPIAPGKPFGGGLMYANASLGTGRDDDIYQLTYGQFFFDEFAFGASLRYHVVDTPGGGDEKFAFDVGLLYTPESLPRWSFGASLLDLNEPNFPGIGTVRRTFNLGAAFRLDEYTQFALDWYDVGGNADRGQLRFGAERVLTDYLAVRAGVAERTLAFGATVNYRGFSLDYGFQAVDNGPDVNMLSLLARF